MLTGTCMLTGTLTGRLPTDPATAAVIGPVAAVIAPVAVADTAVVEVIEAAAATVAEAHPTR
jgi:hypothetical protein